MYKLLTFLSFMAFPLMAEELPLEPYEPYERSFSVPEGAVQMGKITIQNGEENTWGNAADGSLELKYVLSTEWGDVVFKINRTKNDRCDPPCPDTWTVLSVPPNYIVRPEEIIIPEGGFGVFEMYLFQGM